jgi:HupE / UreJ protein
MKTKLPAAVALSLTLGMPGFAHRLDEYLQATIISIEKDRVQASMRLIPGVAVYPIVLASIDTNADGVISQSEQHAYAEQVLRDLSLSIDGHLLEPRLVSAKVPKMEEIKQGLGEIQIEFDAVLPPGEANRKLVLENHHQSRIAAYLMNCLMPRDPDIRVTAQNRNQNQSLYAVEYTERVGRFDALSSMWPSGAFGGFGSMFRLGMRHIAEGTDHLLFLLALLLPAPLLVFGSGWAGFAGLRHSFAQILKVVTAFTVGHSITLALAGLGLVLVPTSPVEVLIAVSILVSAVHALRPLFPGRYRGILWPGSWSGICRHSRTVRAHRLGAHGQHSGV